MSISNVQAGTGIFNAVNSNAKPATSAGLESNSSISTNPVDSVTISEKAKKTVYSKPVEEQIDGMYQRMETIYERTGWGVLEFGKKSLSENLPENQPLIDKLHAEYPQSNQERQDEIEYRLRTLQEWGHEYYFPDEESLTKIRDIQNMAINRFMSNLSTEEIQAQMKDSQNLVERGLNGEVELVNQELRERFRSEEMSHMTDEELKAWGRMLEEERFGS